jgi:hypothetical protein
MEIENPTGISQGSRGTCSMTTLTMLLAIQQPSEYARIVGELATPGGVAVLKNGEKIVRARDWQSVPNDERTVSGKLAFPALMEHANGPNQRYDQVRDVDVNTSTTGALWARMPDPHEGGQGFVTPTLRALTGKNYETIPALDKYAARRELEQLTKHQEYVPASLRFGENLSSPFHEVLIVGVSDAKVEYLNPWGQREQMGASEFFGRLQGYSAVRGARAPDSRSRDDWVG